MAKLLGVTPKMPNLVEIITDVRKLNHLYFIIEIESEELATITKPGNFFQIKKFKSSYPFLRKPISIYDVKENKLQFLIKVIGNGTKYLSEISIGDKLDLIGPLGNNFPTYINSNLLLVSGGIGYASLFYYNKLMKSKNNVFWMHGGRTKEEIFKADLVYTDNGDCGKKGFITDGLNKYLTENKPDAIFICGPPPMIKKCIEIAKTKKILSYVSLEEYMACGVGACLGCAIKIFKENDSTQYMRVCKDGPIFKGSEVYLDD